MAESDGTLGQRESDFIPRTYPLGDKMAGELLNRFTYHAPHPDQLPRYRMLREGARLLAEAIVRYTPPSREQSAALTHLESAIMFANAAIAREPRPVIVADPTLARAPKPTAPGDLAPIGG